MASDLTEDTKTVRTKLVAAGWHDPNAGQPPPSARTGTGVAVFAFERAARDGGRLRAEHRPDEATVHLRVSDSATTGIDFVFHYEGDPESLVDALIKVQDDLTSANVYDHIDTLLAASPESYVMRNSQRTRLSTRGTV